MIFYDLWEFVRHISFLSSRFGYSRTIADHKVELGHFGALVMDGVCVCVWAMLFFRFHFSSVYGWEEQRRS